MCTYFGYSSGEIANHYRTFIHFIQCIVYLSLGLDLRYDNPLYLLHTVSCVGYLQTLAKDIVVKAEPYAGISKFISRICRTKDLSHPDAPQDFIRGGENTVFVLHPHWRIRIA